MCNSTHCTNNLNENNVDIERTKHFVGSKLENKKVTNLIVCGIETHICIQQTVIDCLKKGFEVILISDAMSSRNKVDHDIALKRMVQVGAILTTTESMIFELCKTADRKEFKEIKNIIMS